MTDILQAIDRFISQRMYHYALLISGKWGCGKTYFIQEILIDHLKKQTNTNGAPIDVNYLSLYGVESPDEISQMLCVQAIKDRLGKAGQLADTKGGQIATVLISAAAKVGLGKIGADNTDIEKLIAAIPNYKNNVIIFDDLERCCCDISEILGYINNFVEHSEASIILVANEDEIGNWQLDRNPEMQMLVALNERIDVEVEPTAEEFIQSIAHSPGRNEKIKRESYTLAQLEQRRRAIFHSNESYRRMKEKVIGQTIYYEPDLRVIYPKIVEQKITIPNLRSDLLEFIDDLIGIAEKEEHNNLRTFQFFLEKVAIIFNAIKDNYSSLEYMILLYAFRVSVQYMKGIELPPWDGDYGDRSFSEKLSFDDHLFGFKFVDELIIKNHFDEVYINRILTQFARLAEEKGRLTNDPYQKIRDWYLASDGEVKDWLTTMEENIKNGIYSTELYTGILFHIAKLYSCNVMTDHCDRIHTAMMDYIKRTEPEKLVELEPEHFMLDGDADRKYKELRVEIEELMKAKKQQSEKRLFEEALTYDDWGSRLLKLASNNGNVKGRSFIFWLAPSAIAERIRVSNNAELQQFRFAMQCYYDRHTCYEEQTDDVEHLSELMELLDNIDKSGFGQIQRCYYSWIVNDIKRYLAKICPAT